MNSFKKQFHGLESTFYLRHEHTCACSPGIFVTGVQGLVDALMVNAAKQFKSYGG